MTKDQEIETTVTEIITATEILETIEDQPETSKIWFFLKIKNKKSDERNFIRFFYARYFCFIPN
jgi:hypothetical protein